MRVLVIEDYEPIRSAISQALAEDGFAVDAVADGRDGMWQAKSNEHDVIVLDIMLPHSSGLEILQAIRASKQTTPVLLLTALDAIDQRVKGLDTGADDYLVKPFAINELLARVRALIRRSYGDANAVIEIGDLEIDTTTKRVRRAGDPVDLTSREFALLELLARRRGEVVSRTEIWESLYDFQNQSTSNVVDVYIGYLRKKLDTPDENSRIETRRGQGYRFKLGVP